MPIDPMLVNGIRPVISPNEALQQGMTLRDMVTQNALQQEHLRAAQLGNQQTAQAVADDQAYRQLVARMAQGQAQTQTPAGTAAPATAPAGGMAGLVAGPGAQTGPNTSSVLYQGENSAQTPPSGNPSFASPVFGFGADPGQRGPGASMQPPAQQPPPQQAPVQQQQQAMAPSGMPGPKAGAIGMPGANYADMVQALRSQGLYKQADAVLQAGIANQEKLAIAQKDQSEAAHFDVQTAEKRHGFAAQSVNAILNASPEDRPGVYQQVRARGISAGHFTTTDLPEAYPGDASVTALRDELSPIGDQIALRKAALEKQEMQAKLPGLNAESQMKVLSAYAQAHPEDLDAQKLALTAKERADLANTASQMTETSRHNRVGEQQGNQRIGIENRRVGIEAQNSALRRVEVDPYGTLGVNTRPTARPGPNVTGQAYLDALPTAMAAQVRAIAEGREAPLTGFTLTKPAGQMLMAAVNQYDPTFTADRGKMRAAFSTGKQGQNIQALNTATVHLDQLNDAAQAIAQGSLRPGNALWNRISTELGSAAPTNFEALKSAVSGELANALKGNATDVEIHNIEKTLQTQNSPEQLAGFVKTQIHVLGAKLNTYDEQYQQKIPGDKFSPVLPTAKTVFAKHGFDPIARNRPATAASSGVTVTDPKGGVHVFPNQAAADNFKKAAGIR